MHKTAKTGTSKLIIIYRTNHSRFTGLIKYKINKYSINERINNYIRNITSVYNFIIIAYIFFFFFLLIGFLLITFYRVIICFRHLSVFKKP